MIGEWLYLATPPLSRDCVIKLMLILKPLESNTTILCMTIKFPGFFNHSHKVELKKIRGGVQPLMINYPPFCQEKGDALWQ